METISLKRIGLLMRFYWRTEKKRYLRLFLTFFAIFLVKTAVIEFIFMHINADVYNLSHYALTQWIFWGGIVIVLSFLFDAVHHKQRAIDALCLPANNAEKFLSRLILGLVGVPLIVNVALLAATAVVVLFLGTMDSLAGNQPDWERIFSYYYAQTWFTDLRNTFYGFGSISNVVRSIFWDNMFALVFYTFFIWFGTAFRRLGWVYAFIAFFVVVALCVFTYEVAGIRDTHLFASPASTKAIFSCILLLSLPFTVLAYHSFCRAQIVNHKFFTL
ncbi:MAG: hypothetical protein IJV33_01785 [Bacteroidaceae bacterium]|nr:hypothetical protein [Bacteroidaceae bacterium]